MVKRMTIKLMKILRNHKFFITCNCRKKCKIFKKLLTHNYGRIYPIINCIQSILQTATAERTINFLFVEHLISHSFCGIYLLFLFTFSTKKRERDIFRKVIITFLENMLRVQKRHHVLSLKFRIKCIQNFC